MGYILGRKTIALGGSMPGGAIPLNTEWRNSNAGSFGTSGSNGPWVLTNTNGYYYLVEDISVPGMGFMVGAAGVTLDLNGHRLTYNAANAPTITNADFSANAVGSTSITGWTCSGTATVVADSAGPLQYPLGLHFYGSQNLKITVPTAKSGTASLAGTTLTIATASHGLTTGDFVFLYGLTTTPALNGVYQVAVTDSGVFTISSQAFTAQSGTCTWSKATYLESADIALNGVGCYYTGTIQTADAQSLSDSHSSWLEIRQSGAALTQIGTSVDQTMTSGRWSDYANQTRANTTVATCGITDGSPVRLRLYVGNAALSGSQDVFIGRATLTKAYQPGVLMPGGYEGQLPAYDYMTSGMKTRYVSSKSNAGFTVKSSAPGGSITQGSGKGFRSHAIQADFCYGALTVQDIGILVTGDDTLPVILGHRGTTVGNGGTILIGGDGHGITASFGNVNVTRRFNLNTALGVSAALQSVEISNNTVYDFPQRGCGISVATTNTSATTIRANALYGKAIVTNAYGIYANTNGSVTGNTVDGLTRPYAGCQGIYCGAGPGITLSNATITNNLVKVQVNGNREERTTSPCRAFRLRNQEGGVSSTSNAVLSNITVTGNTFEAFTSTGKPNRADGIRISVIHRNGSSGTGITISDNTCRAITGDASLTACAANIDGIESGTGISVSGNTYDSNHTGMQLCWSDSPGLGVTGVDFVGSVFTKNTTYAGAATMTYQPVVAGDINNGGVSSTRFLSTSVGSGVTFAFSYAGSATKTIDVGYRVNATVTRQADSTAISGATVTVTNTSSATDSTGTTNGSGVVSGLAAITTTYTGTSSPSATSHTPHAYSIVASGYTTANGSLGVMSADATLTIAMS